MRAQEESHKSVCLMVTSEMSAITFYRDYLSFLRERGWAVTVVATDHGGLQDLAQRERVKWVDLPMARNPSPVRDIRSLLHALVILKRTRPSVIVSATPKAGLVGTLAARLSRVPVRVYQLWGLRLETTAGWRRQLFKFLEKVAARSATHVVANSRSLALEVEKLGIARRCVVLGPGSSHGVDLARFSRDAADLPRPDAVLQEHLRAAAAPVIGYVGRIHRDKGVDDLLSACARYVGEGRALTLLVVGPVEDERLATELRAQRPGLQVLFAGNQADPRPYFALMDVFCLPTLREGFPNVVLEASGFCLPTITTTATGARDAVVDGETGLLVPPQDVGALSEALTLLIEDRELRERYGLAARRRVEQCFEKTRIFDVQERYLADLLTRVTATTSRNNTIRKEQ